MKKHRLTARETIQVIAALRYWGRAMEGDAQPERHPMVARRFSNAGVLPLTLDEIETLIGRLDGTWTSRGLRVFDGWKYL